MKHILVTGSHRSGTTWMGNMISLADNLHYIDEIFNPARDPGRCQINFPKWFTHIPTGVVEPYYTPLKKSIIDHHYHLTRGLNSARTSGEVRASLSEFWRNLRVSWKPGVRSVLKDPIALFSAEWLAEMFEMSVVLMIRHPAGFASSLIKHKYQFPFEDLLSQEELMNSFLTDFSDQIRNAPDTVIGQAILLWRIFYSVVRDYQQKHNDWLFLRYEDIAADPLNEFEQIYNSLNLSWNSKIKKRIEAFSSSENPVESIKTMEIKRNSRKMAAQWKRRLSAADIMMIKVETADIWPSFYTEEDW